MANFTKIKKFITKYLKDHLSKDLYYHGLHHTLDVLNYVIEIAEAEKITKNEIKLLKIAVLFHDAGFINTYIGHEDESCRLAQEHLPEFNVKPSEIDLICGMIRATRIPQRPNNLLEMIIADADLLYLGTSHIEEISNTLYKEMGIYFDLKTEKKWNEIQKSFIEKHYFYTNYCRNKYEKTKQLNLKKVITALKKQGK